VAGLRALFTRVSRKTAKPPAQPPSSAQWIKPGSIEFEYEPRQDGRPDPGEIVWTWVPFEEGDGRGKDRPLLVIARDGAMLLGLMLTSKDHDRDAAREAQFGRHWFDVGSGTWDQQGRPSEVRLDRVLRVPAGEVRREGAALDRTTFFEVAAAMRHLHS
jgi:hypothetical protein